MDLVRPFGGRIGVNMRMDHPAWPHPRQHDPWKHAAPIVIWADRLGHNRFDKIAPLWPGRAVMRPAPVQRAIDKAQHNMAGRIQRFKLVGLGGIFRLPHRLGNAVNGVYQGRAVHRAKIKNA